MSILLVEDEALIAFDLEDSLRTLGQEVIVFSSANDASIWLKNNLPKVAVLDFQLRDGTCADIARHLLGANVPMIVHTAREETLEAFDSDLRSAPVFRKPADTPLLVGAIMQTVSENTNG